MIDIQKARLVFKEFINKYDNQEDFGFNLKVVHTYFVSNNAKELATKLNLSEEDIQLAELIGLLHDIGRFEEIRVMNGFNSAKFNHATYASKMLFEDNLIRKFIEDDKYDYIIKNAIENHNRLKIEENLDDRSLLHARIIRDADKLDNYRVKKEEKIEEIFAGRVNSKEELEESLISDKVYETVLLNKCVDIHDRNYPLDYWICVLAFTFDLYFKETLQIVKDNNYISVLVDRFNYKNKDSKTKMEKIKKVLNDYIEVRLNK